MLKKHLHTVILPTVLTRIKKPELLQKALASISHQTHQPDNLIIILDKEPNHDQKLYYSALMEQVFNHCSIKTTILINTRSINLSGSINTAIDSIISSQINGCENYISFLDDDDWWDKNYLLEKEKSIYEQDENKIVYIGSIVRVDTTNNEIKPTILRGDTSAQDFFAANPGVQGSNLTIPFSLLLQLRGFDESLDCCTDRDICIRLINENTKFKPTPKAIMHHVTNHGLDRLSSSVNIKNQCLNDFYHKWSGLFNTSAQQVNINRAKKVFNSDINLAISSTVHVLIGVISVEPQLLLKLISSLSIITTVKFDLVLFLNGYSDINKGLLDNINTTIFRSNSKLQISEARNFIQDKIFQLCTIKKIEPIVWMLDEDITIDNRANDYLPRLSVYKKNGTDVIIGSINGDSPNAAFSGLELQLFDLLCNLQWLQKLNPQSTLPLKSDKNKSLRDNYPDYYYALSSMHSEHLNIPCWIEPSFNNETVEQAINRILCRLDDILSGKNVFRVIVDNDINNEQESMFRGPNTFILNLHCLAVKNPVIIVNNIIIRRSDMLWAVKNKYEFNRKIISMNFCVNHTRCTNVDKELLLQKTHAENIGSVIFNSFHSYLTDKKNSSFEAILVAKVKKKQESLERTFIRSKEILQKLRELNINELEVFLDTLDKVYTPQNMLSMLFNLDAITPDILKNLRAEYA